MAFKKEYKLSDQEKMECVVRWLNELWRLHTTIWSNDGVYPGNFTEYWFGKEDELPDSLSITDAHIAGGMPCRHCPLNETKCRHQVYYTSEDGTRFALPEFMNFGILEQFTGEGTSFPFSSIGQYFKQFDVYED